MSSFEERQVIRSGLLPLSLIYFTQYRALLVRLNYVGHDGQLFVADLPILILACPNRSISQYSNSMLEKVKPVMLCNKNYTSIGMALSSSSGSSSIDFIPGLVLVYIFDSYKNSRLIVIRQRGLEI
jgi:hypothetical protein